MTRRPTLLSLAVGFATGYGLARIDAISTAGTARWFALIAAVFACFIGTTLMMFVAGLLLSRYEQRVAAERLDRAAHRQAMREWYASQN
ncbi:hypothetical protein UFOVP1305_7 [uncultured Caudovirales phage]|uniref:Uncharacterized protein n=1 Tax=uncultured Caudovirales phage TaxID=2100421 RepID=A0A6J5PEP1_9CAUD|nr:hypothetical protein UFOVP896_45 [uncultured Caudovirales phage]CAB4197325.1 hypothetical protein UFOVP1305_7 [uncultured Caudovirales phage]